MRTRASAHRFGGGGGNAHVVAVPVTPGLVHGDHEVRSHVVEHAADRCHHVLEGRTHERVGGSLPGHAGVDEVEDDHVARAEDRGRLTELTLPDLGEIGLDDVSIPETSPASPRVAQHTVTAAPSRAEEAIAAPHPKLSSSGWASTTRRRGRLTAPWA